MAKRVLSAVGVVAFAALAGIVAAAVTARAQESQFPRSDRTAGYIVFPKVVVDVNGDFHDGRAVDTVVQITNTSQLARVVHCFYVDATSHCSNAPTTPCEQNSNCPTGGLCRPGWVPQNFTFLLTPNQPFGWRASEGFLSSGLCIGGPHAGDPCSNGSDCDGGTCGPLASVVVGTVPPLEPLFIGELKCVEVADTASLAPINSNDLKGVANIEEVTSGSSGTVDIRSYNAIGFQTALTDGSTQTDPATQEGDRVLCLGSNGSDQCETREYAYCPSSLVLNHFFDQDAPADEEKTTTDVTFVPCSETLLNGAAQTSTTAQFLVYNEFEQRTSASTRVNCFREVQLSDIDSPRQHSTSIFNIAVQGTLTGQTRIRPVQGNETDTGHGLLAIGEQFDTQESPPARTSSAFNLNYIGLDASKADFVRYNVATVGQ